MVISDWSSDVVSSDLKTGKTPQPDGGRVRSRLPDLSESGLSSRSPQSDVLLAEFRHQIRSACSFSSARAWRMISQAEWRKIAAITAQSEERGAGREGSSMIRSRG